MSSDKDKKLVEALRINLLKRKHQKKIAGENANRYRKKNIGVSSLLDDENKNKNET
tara:strand:- start:1186 stop:1353 length:168 start_codon:yes stop_codon:yes gene_type:complete